MCVDCGLTTDSGQKHPSSNTCKASSNLPILQKELSNVVKVAIVGSNPSSHIRSENFGHHRFIKLTVLSIPKLNKSNYSELNERYATKDISIRLKLVKVVGNPPFLGKISIASRICEEGAVSGKSWNLVMSGKRVFDEENGGESMLS